MHRKELGRLVRVFRLRTNLSDPAVLGRWLLHKHVDHIVSHSFLSDDDFLTTIDNEIAALVISAILTVFDPLVLVQTFELAEVTSKHDRDFTDVDSGIILLKDDSFDLTFALACCRVIIEVVF